MKHHRTFLKDAGFTIMEMLVVLAIIAIVSGFMVVNFRKGEENGKLQRSIQLVVQNIRKIQNFALSSKEFNNPSSGNLEIPDGYVLYFDNGEGVNTFYIYADFDSDKDRDVGETIETIKLEKSIFFDEIIYLKSAGPPQAVDYTNIICSTPDSLITFQPPSTAVAAIITIKKEGVICSSDCQNGTSCSSDKDCRAVKVVKDSGQITIIK